MSTKNVRPGETGKTNGKEYEKNGTRTDTEKGLLEEKSEVKTTATPRRNCRPEGAVAGIAEDR